MSDIIIRSSPLAAEAASLLDGLALESGARYGANAPGGPRAEIDRYPPSAFEPPLGDFLLIRRGHTTIAGGAFMSHDDETAEIKRIWTHPDLRRQGLARRIMQALETRAAELGYTRAYLTTGFRQPEAVALYIALGYRPLFNLDDNPELYRSLPFEKYIGRRAGETGTSPLRKPATSIEDANAEVASIKAVQEAKIIARIAARQLAREAALQAVHA